MKQEKQTKNKNEINKIEIRNVESDWETYW